jgi:hypothetical protein
MRTSLVLIALVATVGVPAIAQETAPESTQPTTDYTRSFLPKSSNEFSFGEQSTFPARGKKFEVLPFKSKTSAATKGQSQNDDESCYTMHSLIIDRKKAQLGDNRIQAERTCTPASRFDTKLVVPQEPETAAEPEASPEP